jgi:hypothetical protein
MKKTLILLLCLAGLSQSGLVQARTSRDAAAQLGQQALGGRALSVDMARQGQKDVWRVKVITPKGEVRVIYVDADTGSLSSDGAP